MTIEWRYTVEENLGILTVAGYLGPDAVRRFTGAVGWVMARGSGPVVVDLTGLRSWSAEGQSAIVDAARRLAAGGRSLELAALPAAGSPVLGTGCPPIPVHVDLTAAVIAHRTGDGTVEEHHEWRTTGLPTAE